MIDEKYIAVLCASMVMSTQLSYGTYRNISKTRINSVLKN